jgi:hypothetical protein
VTAFAAAQPQQAVRQDAAREEGVELVFDEGRRYPVSAAGADGQF